MLARSLLNRSLHNLFYLFTSVWLCMRCGRWVQTYRCHPHSIFVSLPMNATLCSPIHYRALVSFFG